jgi:signal transduction histidine kinase
MNQIHRDDPIAASAVLNGKEKQDMANEEFTGDIHDLRSPLTSVRSLTEILHDYPNINGKKRREFLGIIIQEIERMTGIIKRAESSV